MHTFHKGVLLALVVGIESNFKVIFESAFHDYVPLARGDDLKASKCRLKFLSKGGRDVGNRLIHTIGRRDIFRDVVPERIHILSFKNFDGVWVDNASELALVLDIRISQEAFDNFLSIIRNGLLVACCDTLKIGRLNYRPGMIHDPFHEIFYGGILFDCGEGFNDHKDGHNARLQDIFLALNR